MAPSAKKRGPPPKIAAMKARKRQKLEDPSPQATTTPTPKPAKRRRVRLDELQWNEVSMPDRLEDFEGFYGLEEIDDVEVVRDEGTGKVSFETAKPVEVLPKNAKQANGVDELETPDDEGSGSDGESWGGFSDNDAAVEDAAEGAEDIELEEDQEIDVASSSLEADDDKEDDATEQLAPKSKAKAKAKAQENTKAKHKKDAQAASTESAPSTSAFEILANRTWEDDDEEVDVSAWEDLALSSETLESLSRLKFSQPTPIQSSAIPEIMAGHDVIGKASTGSGKTLAFGIPILESFLSSKREARVNKAPLALIVSPTRELAHQISAHLTALSSKGSFDGPSIVTITGGLSVQKQRRLLEKADIVIGTPGRLWEVISSGQGVVKSFQQIRFLVVDEADRLLSQGHYKEMEEIVNVLDRRDDREDENEDEAEESEATHADESVVRQTLVFSATFHKGLQQKLASKSKQRGDLMDNKQSMEYLLKKLRFREEKPKFIDMNPQSQMASGLKEGLIECAGTEKDLFLYTLLLFHPKKRALVFTNSISAVRRLTPFLQNLNLQAFPLHSQMPQKARLRSVEKFTAQPGSILVATDVAARGLDIPGVQVIIHYHLPRAADTYVHRSGRTARAETSGSSILICAPEEVVGVRRLIAKVHARSKPDTKSKKAAYFIRTLDIDRRIVSRLKPRATLSKKLADAVIAKEKQHSADDWMRAAAEDLGVDYDSETFENEAPGRKGRGAGRKKKEKLASEMTKAELQGMRAELRSLLSERVNIGVSTRYLTSGGVDVDALLNGTANAEFLGTVDGLGLDDDA